jgi:integrase
VPIPAFLADTLAVHLSDVPPELDTLLSTDSAGGLMDWSDFRRRIWQPALAAAKLNPKLRIHELRHIAASILISQSAHSEVVHQHL